MYMFHLETKVKTAYNYKESKGNHNRFQTVNMADNDIRRMWNDRTNSTVESEDSDEPLAIIDDINAKTEETNENIEEKKVTEETGDEFKSYLDTLYLDGVTDQNDHDHGEEADEDVHEISEHQDEFRMSFNEIDFGDDDAKAFNY